MNFTYKTYKNILIKLKKDYKFVSFSKIKFSNETFKKSILLRHDIDQSLEKTIPISEIESELGIIATYFLFLRSPFYNIFSPASESIVRKILKSGHLIGLHFDFTKYSNISVSETSYQIMKEIDFIQTFFNIKIDAVSFHRPISLKFFRNLELSTYPHTYEPIFVDNFKYFSDSRGIWRFGNPFESEEYRKKENIHLLIHPIWWNEKSIKPIISIKKFRERYLKHFNENINSELKSFWENLKNEKE